MTDNGCDNSKQVWQLALGHAKQSLEVTTASDDEALRFGVLPGTIMLLLEGVTYTAGEQPVEAFKARTRPGVEGHGGAILPQGHCQPLLSVQRLT
jgi:DNA-binding GntR family transcriptional regulator